MNESNNRERVQRDVSSYQVFYGGSKSEIRLGTSNSRFTSWPASSQGEEIFFSDTDSSYSFSDLEPLNGTDDLSEATEALEMIGHNDSVKEDYDSNGDGEADYTRCVDVSGSEKCQIPFVNSTNTSNFQTGILHDAENGYDGSQNLVFLTLVNNSKQGSYGVYDYEANIPSALQRLKPGQDKLDIYTQLD